MAITVLKRMFPFSLIFGALLLLAGCATDPNPGEQKYKFSNSQFQPGTAYGGGLASGTNTAEVNFSILRVGDLIVISFSDTKEVLQKQEVNIPDTGIVTLPYNVHIKADGKTTTQLEKEIRDAYVPTLFVNLTVSVRVEQRYYFVDGEVRQARSYPYLGETTVLRAIANAGGFTDFANRRKIELRRLNGQRFFINYHKALKDPQMDIPVFPNDHIIVDRSIF